MHAQTYLAASLTLTAALARADVSHAQSTNTGHLIHGTIKRGPRSLGLLGPPPPRVHKRGDNVARGGGPGSTFNPLISFGLDGGIATFSQGVSRAAHPGPSWGARVGLELLPFLTVEARYFGSYHATRDSVAGAGIGLLTQGTAATVRLTWRGLPYVQPYLFGGAGIYYVSVVGNDASSQATPLRGSPSFAIPAGLGVDVPLNRHFTIGGEATYHALLHENLSSRPELSNGDLWSASTVVRFTP